MENYTNSTEIPVGLNMALAQNITEINYFTYLSGENKQQVINHTHQIKSKQEMHSYVQSLVNTNSSI
ncbi:MAG: hypothetical protein WAX04_05485 [Oscillospiraceae bacterium]